MVDAPAARADAESSDGGTDPDKSSRERGFVAVRSVVDEVVAVGDRL